MIRRSRPPAPSGLRRITYVAQGWLSGLGVAAVLACGSPAATGHGGAAAPQAQQEQRAMAAPNTAARHVWLPAARASDWEATALAIDGLSEVARADPGTRYVRAFAAQKLGDCERVLGGLEGLAEALPLLRTEIEEMQSNCQILYGTGAAAMNPVALAGRLTSSEGARSLAEHELDARVQQELDSVPESPGASPSRAELLRSEADAQLRAQTDNARAAALYERAARLSSGRRSKDLLLAAAKAWSRSRQPDRAAAAYERIAQRYPNTQLAEGALHSKAHTFYSSGQWGKAVAAYTRYLSRYGQGRKSRKAQFVLASRYERAVAELARGKYDAARLGFEALLEGPHGGYPTSMLEHLVAVAIAGSGKTRDIAEAAQHFEQIVRDYPLSFAALWSRARLEQMGRSAPLLQPPPSEVDTPLALPEMPAKARLLAELGLNSAAERTLHEEEQTLRALYSPRDGETLCRQYESLDRGWRRYSLAMGTVDADILQRAPTASNLWAWHCLYPRPYVATVERLEQRYQLPAGLMYSVMRQESEFRPDARSRAGAVGLMQLMPGTAEHVARELALPHRDERLTQAEYNLELGAFYLSKLLALFDQRVELAIASYNAGPHAVSRWLEPGRDLPLDIWAARIPYRETRNYVARVMSSWARYRYLGGGPERVPQLTLALPEGRELPTDMY
jgi:peptidoglycan lytic transglycosylase